MEAEPRAGTVRKMRAGSASRRRVWPTRSNVRESLSDRGLDDSDISDEEVVSD